MNGELWMLLFPYQLTGSGQVSCLNLFLPPICPKRICDQFRGMKYGPDMIPNN